MHNGDDLAGTSVITRSDEPIAVEVDDSVVMMSIDQGMYFGLEGVGGRIWSLLEQPRTMDDLCSALLDEFDVAPDECRREVGSFVRELQEARLVTVRHAEPGA